MPKQHVRAQRAPMRDVVANKKTQPITESEQPKVSHLFRNGCLVLVVVVILLLAGTMFYAGHLGSEYLSRAQENVQEKKYTEANKDYIFASALSFFSPKNSGKAYEGIADIAVLRDDHELAVTNYRAAVTRTPADELKEKYAQELFATRRFDAAVAALKDITSRNDSANILLAQALLRQDKFDEAKDAVLQVSESSDRAGTRNTLLSYFALRSHDNEFLTLFVESTNRDFFKTAEKALKKKEFSSSDLVALGNSLLQLNEPDFALDFANKALEKENNYRDALVLKAQALTKRSEFASAQEALDAAMKITLLNRDMWFIQAQLYAAQNEIEKALTAFKKASDLGANTPAFHFAYAKAAKQLVKNDIALSEAQKALALDAQNKVVYLEFIFWRGFDLLQGNTMLQAAKEYQKVLPDDAFGKLAASFAVSYYELDDKGTPSVNEALTSADKNAPNSALAAFVKSIFEKDNAKKRDLLVRAQDLDSYQGSTKEVFDHASRELATLGQSK